MGSRSPVSWHSLGTGYGFDSQTAVLFIGQEREETIIKQYQSRGFTIVELVITIAIIAILATISVVGYGKWRESMTKKEVQSDLQMAATAMENAKNFGNGYPTDGSIPSSFKSSANTTIVYKSGTVNTFCIEGTSKTNTSIHYFIDTTKGKQPAEGTCTGGEGAPGGGTIAIQTITSSNCPTVRTMAVDARDNHTYWVQKLADGKCWMLTNLAYAGGGTNAYGDVKVLQSGASNSYTEPVYYIPSGANPTTDPTQPSTSTDGSGQYGYLYNWCGAMGGQTSTSACADTDGSAPNTDISICPAGWRLPTHGYDGEFGMLNKAVNGGLTSTDTGLRTVWLAQRGGKWDGNGIYFRGTSGYYWSSSQYSATEANALTIQASFAYPLLYTLKVAGYSVRCLAK